MSRVYNNCLHFRWVGMKRYFFLGVLILMGCSRDDGPSKTEEDLSIEVYIETNSLTVTETNGVYTYPIVEGATGNATGSVYSIYYELTTLDGESIDSHQSGDGDPIKLKIGGSAVFPLGLDYGLTNAREGETYGIIVPSQLGYGVYQVSGVSNSTLLFQVEVVTREAEADIAIQEAVDITDYVNANDLNDNDANPLDNVIELSSGVYYKRTEAGVGVLPVPGDSVTINYTGTLLNQTTFDVLDNFDYIFGTGEVIEGLDIGVADMEYGERALIFIPSAQAYGGSVRVIPEIAADELVEQLVIPAYASKVRPYEVLIFDVRLQTNQ